MYLSRLILNTRSREVRRDLADCHELHRTVMSAFPDVPVNNARADLGVLFRVDVDPAGEAVLYVQARERPDWSRLPEGYLKSTVRENPACKRVDHLYEGLRPGMVLRFRLRANPTRKIDTKTDESGRRRHGKRVELRTEEERIAWLKRKGEAGGFELVSVRGDPNVADVKVIVQPKVGRSRPRVGEGDASMKLGSVVYEGHLRVVDADRLRHVLKTGIGTGKAYGFGLLSLAPPGG